MTHFPKSKGKTACGVRIQWGHGISAASKREMLQYAVPALTVALDSVTCTECRNAPVFKNAEITYDFLTVEERSKWIETLDLPKPCVDTPVSRPHYTNTIGDQLANQRTKQENAERLLNLFGSRRPK